jgi:predicted AlkP superfamily pyrophosphatase or phosphodiesterase
LYLDQVVYTDRLFGGFLAQLKERALYDDAVIIVTSDHGLSFDKAHPGRHQQWIAVDDIRRVPLLVKLPGQHRGWIDDRRIMITELYEIIRNILEQHPQTRSVEQVAVRPAAADRNGQAGSGRQAVSGQDQNVLTVKDE